MIGRHHLGGVLINIAADRLQTPARASPGIQWSRAAEMAGPASCTGSTQLAVDCLVDYSLVCPPAFSPSLVCDLRGLSHAPASCEPRDHHSLARFPVAPNSARLRNARTRGRERPTYLSLLYSTRSFSAAQHGRLDSNRPDAELS